MEKNKRAHVFISGRVQGVFFRMETQKMAQQIGVSGWVRNTREGQVEAVIEGSEYKVAEMIKWCWKGSLLAKVKDVALQEEEYLGEFEEFTIVN